LDLLRPNNLWRPVSQLNIDGIRRTTIVRDVLIHVIAEELHHRGEIIAILWQMNFQPPLKNVPIIAAKYEQAEAVIVVTSLSRDVLPLIATCPIKLN
jgi:uncharacterized damage-inducible protein DinB